ncbi:hypothetical protein [Streptomyces vinaceus]|uniref:hypothetical protein n=1 Tax=Streptomyces vinaceus TaxID=1960 RepID=UPI0038219BBB
MVIAGEAPVLLVKVGHQAGRHPPRDVAQWVPPAAQAQPFTTPPAGDNQSAYVTTIVLRLTPDVFRGLIFQRVRN